MPDPDLDIKIRVDSEEATKETAKLNEQKKALIQNLKALRHEHIPGLGQALHLLRHPITAVAVAIGFVVEAIKKWDEATTKAVESSRKIIDIIKPFDMLSEVSRTAAVDAEKFADRLAHIAREAGSAEEKLKLLLDYEKQLHEIKDEQTSAEEKFAIARLKTRQLTDPSYSKAAMEKDIAAVQEFYRKQGEQDKINRIKREDNIRGLGVVNAKINEQHAKEAETAATKDADRAAKGKELNVQFQKANEDEIKKKKDRIVEIDKLLTSGPRALARTFFLGPIGEDRHRARLESEQAQLQRDVDSFESVTGRIGPEGAKERQSQARKELEEATTKRLKAEQELEQFRKINQSRIPGIVATGSLESATAREALRQGQISERRSAEEHLGTLARENIRTMSPMQIQEWQRKVAEAMQTLADTMVEGLNSVSRRVQAQNARTDNITR